MALERWCGKQHAIALRELPGRGRGLVAQKDVAAGSTLLVASPLAVALHPALAGTRCAACFTKCSDDKCKCGAVLCRNCSLVDKEHAVECGVAKVLAAQLCSDDAVQSCLLAARVLRMAREDEDLGLCTPVPAGTDLEGMLDMPRVRQPVQQAVAMLKAASACKGFLPEHLRAAPQKRAIARIVQVFLVIDCNAITILDEQHVRRGLGLYFGSSLLNHSCQPNVCLVHDAPGSLRQEARALRPISAGEELLLSYVDPAMPLWERQKRLSECFWFACDCKLCRRQSLPDEAVKVGDKDGKVLLPILRLFGGEAEEEAQLLRQAGACIAADSSVEPLLRKLNEIQRLQEAASDLSQSEANILLPKLQEVAGRLDALLHPHNITLTGVHLRLLSLAVLAQAWEVAWQLRSLQPRLAELYGPGAAPQAAAVTLGLFRAAHELGDPSAGKRMGELLLAVDLRHWSRQIRFSTLGLVDPSPSARLAGAEFYLQRCRNNELMRIRTPSEAAELQVELSNKALRLRVEEDTLAVLPLPKAIDPEGFEVVRSRRSSLLFVRAAC